MDAIRGRALYFLTDRKDKCVVILSAGAVLIQNLDPAAYGEGNRSAVFGILKDQLIGPPFITAVVLAVEGVNAVNIAAFLMMVLLLGAGSNGRVGGIAAHILAPGREAVNGAGHVGDKGAGSPGQGAVIGNKQVMAVAIAAETGVTILIGCNLDVVLGNGSGFLYGAELGVNQKAELILGGIGNQGIADGTVIGLGIVAANPQLDPEIGRASCRERV